jgi:hypothetical protein
VGTDSSYTPDLAGSYTVTVSASGFKSKTSDAITISGGGTETGAAVAAPTLASKTADSITITAVTPPANGQTVEYAKNTDNTAPAIGWQDGLTFSGLSAATRYYIFARSKANATYAAGAASDGLEVTTDTSGGGVIPDELVGSWGNLETTSADIKINADGSGNYFTNTATWSVSGSTLTMTQTAGGYAMSGSIDFTLNDDGTVLTLILETASGNLANGLATIAGRGLEKLSDGTDITYTAVQTGGVSGTADTTGIVLTFSKTPYGTLSESNITITDGTGKAAKGALSGGGTEWTIAVGGVKEGSVTVAISRVGIESAEKTVAVYARPDGDGITTNKRFSSAADMKTWLDAQSANTAENPYKIALTSGFTQSQWPSSAAAWGIKYNLAGDEGKFVSLDMSECTGLTAIPDSGFLRCSGLVSVAMPPSIESIGEYAFSRCTALESVTIPSSVESIGRNAFSVCTALESVTISEGVESIGQAAFSSCTALKSVAIPSSVGSIGSSAFSACDALETISLPQVTTIEQNTFQVCSALKTVDLPEATTIGSNAFDGCSALETVSIPKATTMGSNAFYRCTNITTIKKI